MVIGSKPKDRIIKNLDGVPVAKYSYSKNSEAPENISFLLPFTDGQKDIYAKFINKYFNNPDFVGIEGIAYLGISEEYLNLCWLEYENRLNDYEHIKTMWLLTHTNLDYMEFKRMLCSDYNELIAHFDRTLETVKARLKKDLATHEAYTAAVERGEDPLAITSVSSRLTISDIWAILKESCYNFATNDKAHLIPVIKEARANRYEHNHLTELCKEGRLRDYYDVYEFYVLYHGSNEEYFSHLREKREKEAIKEKEEAYHRSLPTLLVAEGTYIGDINGCISSFNYIYDGEILKEMRNNCAYKLSNGLIIKELPDEYKGIELDVENVYYFPGMHIGENANDLTELNEVI